MFPAAQLRLYPLYAPLYVYSILGTPAHAPPLLVRVGGATGRLREYTFPVDLILSPPGAGICCIDEVEFGGPIGGGRWVEVGARLLETPLLDVHAR